MTPFSKLDISRQSLVAKFVVQTYKQDFNRVIDEDEVIRLFNAYDIDVEWNDYNDFFEISYNSKLEMAVKNIVSSMCN